MHSYANQLFSGYLRPFPGIPEDWPSTKKDIAAGVLRDVQRVAPEMITAPRPEADVEDFWEDACRISAAYRASGGLMHVKKPGTATSPWDEDEMAHRLGPVAQAEEGGHHAPDTLINDPIVQKFGGRATMLGTLGGNPRYDVVQWLAKRHRDAGVTHGVVKAAAHKNGIWSIELDDDPTVVAKRLMDAMDWDFVRLSELKDSVFAQDRLPLEYEYRLFVVDGEVISGAGCVEEFTPLDRRATSGPFDVRVRRLRGHLDQGEPSTLKTRLEIVSPLIRFGRKVAKEHGGTVVIDVAMDASTGKPVVIELNAMSNSGLYASDPWIVAEKLITARDRGYRLPTPIRLDDLVRDRRPLQMDNPTEK
jgi:hypothetical protein